MPAVALLATVSSLQATSAGTPGSPSYTELTVAPHSSAASPSAPSAACRVFSPPGVDTRWVPVQRMTSYVSSSSSRGSLVRAGSLVRSPAGSLVLAPAGQGSSSGGSLTLMPSSGGDADCRRPSPGGSLAVLTANSSASSL